MAGKSISAKLYLLFTYNSSLVIVCQSLYCTYLHCSAEGIVFLYIKIYKLSNLLNTLKGSETHNFSDLYFCMVRRAGDISNKVPKPKNIKMEYLWDMFYNLLADYGA